MHGVSARAMRSSVSQQEGARVQEGVAGFYRGWSANTLKVVPQNSIRFVAYEAFKSLLGIHKAHTDT